MRAMCISLLMVLVVISCTHKDRPIEVVRTPEPDHVMIQENNQAAKLEMRDIENYVQRHHLSVEQTGTGLQYTIIEDIAGEPAQAEQTALIRYQVSLLDGRICYASAETGPEAFVVEHDHVESGLHEGIQLLSPGDSAILIIPSHLAHGLIGDMDKIPMRSTIVYHLRLLQVK